MSGRQRQPVPALPAATAWRFGARMASFPLGDADLAGVRDLHSLDGPAGLEELA